MADGGVATALWIALTYGGMALGGVSLHGFVEGRRLAAARRDWTRHAERRGLIGGERSIGGGAWQVSFHGVVRGRPVTITAQTPNPTVGWTIVQGHLVPPLDLGLHVGPGEPLIAAPSGASPLRRMPRRASIAADDPARAARLLDPSVLRALDAIEAPSWAATDGAVMARFQTFVTDPRSVEPTIARVLDACDAIDRARAHVEPATALREAAADWRRSSAGSGLAMTTAPLGLAGVLDGIPVAVWARREGDGRFGLGALARFREPLQGAVGLLPTAAGAAATWLGVLPEDLGGEDWLLDDPAFDPVFVVRSRDPAKLPAVLDPHLRARLLAINERTPLVVDDLGVRLAAERLPSAGEVPALLEQLAELAVTIEARVRGGRSPYR